MLVQTGNVPARQQRIRTPARVEIETEAQFERLIPLKSGCRKSLR
jgi:hypothetical protein